MQKTGADIQSYINHPTPTNPEWIFILPVEVHDSRLDFLCWCLYHPDPMQARPCSFFPATGCWSDYHRAESTPSLFSLKKQTFKKRVTNIFPQNIKYIHSKTLLKDTDMFLRWSLHPQCHPRTHLPEVQLVSCHNFQNKFYPLLNWYCH